MMRQLPRSGSAMISMSGIATQTPSMAMKRAVSSERSS